MMDDPVIHPVMNAGKITMESNGRYAAEEGIIPPVLLSGVFTGQAPFHTIRGKSKYFIAKFQFCDTYTPCTFFLRIKNLPYFLCTLALDLQQITFGYSFSVYKEC